MTKWEYMTLTLTATGFFRGGAIDVQVLTDSLCKWGAEGWELVNIFDTNKWEGRTRDVIAVLKRPLAE